MTAPPFAPADLMRQLRALHERQDEFDTAVLRHRPGSEEHRRAQDALEATWNQIWPLEDLILASPPVTLADAAAVLLAAVAKVNYVLAMQDAEEELEAAERGLVAALRVVAKTAGLTPEEMCFRDYLREPPDPAPAGGAA